MVWHVSYATSPRGMDAQEGTTQQYTHMIPSLTSLARGMVRELDPQVRR
jgi:hypothetical protein